MIDVSVIIVNFNTSNYTFEAVKSIYDHQSEDYLSFEIVVIDNNSNLSDYKNLQRELKSLNKPNLKFFRSKKNGGFSQGNMLGVQMASTCKYYAFINNDTLQTHQNVLGALKTFMVEHPDAGICSPQMLDEHKNFRVTIDHFSSLQREILRRPLLEALFPKTYLNRKKRYDKPIKVHYVQGSFMFVDAEVFNALGGLDTNLFLYYEESDLSLRFLKEKGKFTYLIPDLEYIHYKGKSTGKNIMIKIEQKISLLYYIRKHYGWLSYQILIKWYLIRYFFSSIIKPKYWKLFYILFIGAPLSKSLMHKQQINEDL
jgi:hypothetical protein